MCWALNHQNTLEMAQWHISLSMVLIIKRFKTMLKGRKEYLNKNKTREIVHASNAVRLVILLLNVPIMKMIRHKKDMGRRRKRRITGRRRVRRI
jgi:glycerol-3-phosphate cytidylyltransferase-like family protein